VVEAHQLVGGPLDGPHAPDVVAELPIGAHQ